MKTIVIDGNYYLYRAYHSSFKADLRTSKGHPSGAFAVFHRMLKPLMTSPNNIIVVFDTEGKNFRFDIYPEYKANRKPCPPDLILQKKDIRILCRSLGLPVIKHKGVEADDVLGTIARYFTENKMQLEIHTGDKDIAQFVSPYVTLFDSKSGVRTTLETLKMRGLTPKQVTYYLALLGDKVDNVPGVPGIGEVKAMELLKTYGSLKNIVRNIPNIKGKLGKNLADNLELLRLSYKLVQGFHIEELDVRDYRRTKPNKEKLERILDKYEIGKKNKPKGLFSSRFG